jgi:hypothetical protein
LRWNIKGHDLQVDLDHAVDDRNQKEKPGAFGPLEHPSEPKDDATLVLLNDPNGGRNEDQQKDDYYSDNHEFHVLIAS